MPNENIYDPSGFNAMGRWDYGPWMIPPMLALNNTLPSPTIVPEAFMDTVIVNGTPYPYVDAAADSRPLPHPERLQRPHAQPAVVLCRKATVHSAKQGRCGSMSGSTRACTEVRMVPASPNPAYPTWPRDGRDGGVPDPTTQGPDICQIGNEGGFLAKVAVIPPQPVDFDYNRRSVTFGGVTSKSLYLPPAVRADIIVDFSAVPPGSDAHSLQRRARAHAAVRHALRLLHGRSGSDRESAARPRPRPASAPTPGRSCRSGSRGPRRRPST